MKFRVSYPRNNTCKIIEIDNDNKLQSIIGKHIGQIFHGEEIEDVFKGYVFRITGGCDKQGFPMKRGVMTNRRVKMLLKPGQTGYQKWRAPRAAARKRKSVRGAIVGLDLAVLECIIVRVGETPLDGLTNKSNPIQRGPLRASKLRKLFDIEKDFDLTKFLPIYKQKEYKNGGFIYVKKPRVQRLLTPRKIRRRKLRNREKAQRRLRTKQRKEEYKQMLSKISRKK